MACEWLKKDGVVIHINRGRGRGKRMHCRFCDRDYYGGKLCDFPIGNGRTCDAEMCAGCARTVGRQDIPVGDGLKKLADTIDICPRHPAVGIPKNGANPAELDPSEEIPCTFHTAQGTLLFEANQVKNPRG